MANSDVITLPRRAKSDAERARQYRLRKREKANPAEGRRVVSADTARPIAAGTLPPVTPLPATVTDVTAPHVTVERGISTENIEQFPGTCHGTVTSRAEKASVYKGLAPLANLPLSGNGRPLPFSLPAVALRAAALALAGVGITMNGLFARSLGSSDVAGWLFLALGLAADVAALALPTVAAGQCRSRPANAVTAWAVWLLTFAFAISASVGFTATNVADVTQARASRVTPAVTVSQRALDDAMAARDRECKGGVGRFCRDREAAVVEARHALDGKLSTNVNNSDPQTTAAVKLVAWVTRGAVTPDEGDFAMVRLLLLALLPQVGGILLMVGRRA